MLISSRTNKVTSVTNTYFETKFNANNLDWTKIFITTSDNLQYIFAFISV